MEGAGGALHLPHFRALWLAATLSGFGEFLYTVAASWLMLSLTGSALWVGGVVAARTLPMLATSPFAGAVADLWDRRAILLTAHFGMFLVAIAMTVLTKSGQMTATRLLTLIVLLGLFTAFNMPAWHAYLPDIVPSHLVASAVSSQAVAASVAAALGPPAGGVLLAATNPATVFAVNGLTYVPVAAVLLSFAAAPRATRSSALGRSIVDGFAALVDRTYTTAMANAACFAAISGAIAATLPSIAATQGGEVTLGLLFGLSGIGTVVGSLTRRWAIGSLGALAVLVALTGDALAALVTALPAGVEICAVGMFAAGVFGLWGGATLESIVQLATPAELRGRVMGSYMFVFLLALSVSSLTTGWIAAQLGARTGLAIVSALLAGVAAWRWLSTVAKRGRSRRHPRPAPDAHP